MTKRTRRKRLLRGDRGSALLVSLMVIVGLSLLGLGFVALSETEATIAKNEQQALQTQAIAEAGAKLVVEWFQDPIWAVNTAGAPANNLAQNPNLAAIKLNRYYGVNTGSGLYKPDANSYLFDKPYRNAAANRFYGAEQNPDIRINSLNDKADMDKVNAFVLGTNSYDTSGGEIFEIDVYAPPMVGNVLTPDPSAPSNLFWVGSGTRYGVATVKVTAVQLRDNTLTGNARYQAANIKAQHSVKIVVGEIPLPIPGGPIQSNASISFGGDFVVHWGMETATGNLTNKRNPSSLPWANAYERPHFEHGYEPGSSIAQVIVTSGGSGYASAPIVTIDPPGGGGTTATATATVTNGSVTSIAINPAPGSHGSGYVAIPPNWGPNVTFSGGGGTGASAQAVIGHEVWPIANGSQFDNAFYLQELLNTTYEDPWFGSRSVGDNMADGTTPNGANPMCYPYSYSSIETSANNAPYSFQWQATNTYPWIKRVVFPAINYQLWKRITQTGRGYKGLYYFNYAGSGNFQKFGTGAPQPMYYWANSISPGANMGAGVYFFDTTNGANPQGITNPPNLTPAEMWNSQSFAGSFLMCGFIYMNAQSFGTKGQGNSMTTVNALFPGEPYRDIGYPVWDPAANAWKNCGGQVCRAGVGDGSFSYQDLNNNGKFDVVVMPAPAWNSYDGKQFTPTTHNAGSTYIVKTWKSPAQATADYGAPCTIPAATYNGTNAAATDCSEPHEPYLNLIYPAAATSSVTVGWEAPGSQTYRPKLPNVTCTASSSPATCTSNAWDENGAMVPLDVILQGILYNEGDYDSQGNATYYGSVLIQGNVGGTGTPDVWFDETLIKGTWAPPRMPRVVVFSEQTDEIGQ